ncbi:unnamed protein product [Heligmosomoides polygyrus]|uniref:MADF domain-containing protein n=1 Tax=Heligmosomoides polygyrus TaxID=6339 RepID=A0A183GBJ9_HELPZ|nr:unnamed protein product [Heligmosomoides polygyrus]
MPSHKRIKLENPGEFTVMSTAERYSLIDAVRGYTELWDDKDPNFKDNIKRTRAWSVVKRDLEEIHGKDFSEEILSRTFKNLKDTYRRKVKEIKDHNSRATGCEASDNVEKIKAWPYFDALAFLDPVFDQGTRFTSVWEAVDVEGDIEFEESSSASTPSSRPKTPQAPPSFCSVAELGRKDNPKVNHPRRSIDGLTSAINSLKESNAKMDRTDSICMHLRATLQEMKQTRPDLFAKWSIKTDEFILTMSRDLYEVDRE